MLILFLTKYSFQKYIRLALNKKVARIYISDPNKVTKNNNNNNNNRQIDKQGHISVYRISRKSLKE